MEGLRAVIGVAGAVENAPKLTKSGVPDGNPTKRQVFEALLERFSDEIEVGPSLRELRRTWLPRYDAAADHQPPVPEPAVAELDQRWPEWGEPCGGPVWPLWYFRAVASRGGKREEEARFAVRAETEYAAISLAGVHARKRMPPEKGYGPVTVAMVKRP